MVDFFFFILVCLGWSWFVLVCLGWSLFVLVCLGLSWFVLDCLGFSRPYGLITAESLEGSIEELQ